MGSFETKIISIFVFDINENLVQALELKVKENTSSREIAKQLYSNLSQYSEKYDMNISFDLIGRKSNDFSYLNKTKNIIVQLNNKNHFDLLVTDELIINK